MFANDCVVGRRVQVTDSSSILDTAGYANKIGTIIFIARGGTYVRVRLDGRGVVSFWCSALELTLTQQIVNAAL